MHQSALVVLYSAYSINHPICPFGWDLGDIRGHANVAHLDSHFDRQNCMQTSISGHSLHRAILPLPSSTSLLKYRDPYNVRRSCFDRSWWVRTSLVYSSTPLQRLICCYSLTNLPMNPNEPSILVRKHATCNLRPSHLPVASDAQQHRAKVHLEISNGLLRQQQESYLL